MKNLDDAWPQIMEVVRRTRIFLIASINDDGSPHITPIGTVFLRPDHTGYYIEKYPVGLRRNVERDQRVCIYAADATLRLWLRALVTGRAPRTLAVRLIARAGERRALTPEEHRRWLHKVRQLRWTRGYKQLWAEMHHARDLEIIDYAPVELGPLTRHLWT